MSPARATTHGESAGPRATGRLADHWANCDCSGPERSDGDGEASSGGEGHAGVRAREDAPSYAKPECLAYICPSAPQYGMKGVQVGDVVHLRTWHKHRSATSWVRYALAFQCGRHRSGLGRPRSRTVAHSLRAGEMAVQGTLEVECGRVREESRRRRTSVRVANGGCCTPTVTLTLTAMVTMTIGRWEAGRDVDQECTFTQPTIQEDGEECKSANGIHYVRQ
ncbi:hypothetical protein C8Q77DRAFT_837980 [Trametes polyzona]|nr:hypothetical protein C8Q77DRAFT_837980 [Trametes polyzona]